MPFLKDINYLFLEELILQDLKFFRLIIEIFLEKRLKLFTHKGKPFFNDLINFMTSGTICVLALGHPIEAVENFRKLIGDTDPKKSKIGTIRNLYGTDIGHNAIHGADSEENAMKEILFFFPNFEKFYN
jgi:nucleoside diphosphate kinase